MSQRGDSGTQMQPMRRTVGGMHVNANGPRQPKVRLEEKKQPKPTQADMLYPETRKKPWRPVNMPRLEGVEASAR